MANNLVREKMLDAGLQITKQRDVIADILARSKKALTSNELCEIVQKEHPEIGRATIFRTLQSLENANITQRIRLAKNQFGFLLCLSETHHHHLICKDCSNIVEIDDRHIVPFLNTIESAHRFEVDHANFDIYGTCNNCHK
jgi:Fur family ferric uptake transcriptional regulator